MYQHKFIPILVVILTFNFAQSQYVSTLKEISVRHSPYPLLMDNQEIYVIEKIAVAQKEMSVIRMDKIYNWDSTDWVDSSETHYSYDNLGRVCALVYVSNNRDTTSKTTITYQQDGNWYQEIMTSYYLSSTRASQLVSRVVYRENVPASPSRSWLYWTSITYCFSDIFTDICTIDTFYCSQLSLNTITGAFDTTLHYSVAYSYNEEKRTLYNMAQNDTLSETQWTKNNNGLIDTLKIYNRSRNGEHSSEFYYCYSYNSALMVDNLHIISLTDLWYPAGPVRLDEKYTITYNADGRMQSYTAFSLDTLSSSDWMPLRKYVYFYDSATTSSVKFIQTSPSPNHLQVSWRNNILTVVPSTGMFIEKIMLFDLQGKVIKRVVLNSMRSEKMVSIPLNCLNRNIALIQVKSNRGKFNYKVSSGKTAFKKGVFQN